MRASMRSFRTSRSRDILSWLKGWLSVLGLRLQEITAAILTGFLCRLLRFHPVRGTPEYAMCSLMREFSLVYELHSRTGDVVAILLTIDTSKQVTSASQQWAQVSEGTPCEGVPEEPA